LEVVSYEFIHNLFDIEFAGYFL